jgi:uncharacterized surface protein with fasciclin (FAS1) repeats
VTTALVAVGVMVFGVTGCAEETSDAVPTDTAAEAVDTTTTTLGPYVPPLGDIVGEALVAANVPDLAGQFATLAGLLIRADLVQPLRGEGPFTVFAPLNAAFEKLPAATLDAVYDDPDLLAAVLTYHVVPGEYTMADIDDGTELETLQGTTLTITKKGGTTFVNGVEIAAADVPATNGLINVIGEVLVPE